jgi:hypothetical protein
MPEKPTLSIPEICAAGNFGRTTAFGFIKSGALRAVKIGRRTVVLDEDFKAFLKNLPEANSKASAKLAARR